MNDSSKVINYSYTAYGDLLPDSPTPNAFGYNAEATDYNTGLQYLRARYYNTDTGRFIQKDEYKGDFTQPGTLNRYAYCAGNPVNRIDPSGQDSYILYDENAISGDGNHTFLDEAKIRAEQLGRRYGTKVLLIGVSSAEEFLSEWNEKVGFDAEGNSVDIEEAYIIAHGAAAGDYGEGVGYMFFGEGESISRLVAGSSAIKNSSTDVMISGLDVKTIWSLYFSSCNSGNPDICNTATAFNNRMNITGHTTAWDGGTVYNYETEQLEIVTYANWIIESRRQHTYYKYVEKNWYKKPKRKRQGKVVY